MKYRIKRKIGYVLVVAMLVVMIYPGELSAASGQEDGFVIKGTTLQGYVGAENAVVIPDNITKIDDDVFLNTTITSVEIPDSVTTIGDNAFAGCEYLTEVTVPDSVTKIGDNVFYGCTSLESATWESREGIGDGTFAECAGLTDLSISKELPSIGKEAFKNCESLESIVIPEATKTIASDAFDGCVNMQSIDVEEGNTYFMSYDNALYTANGVTLYRCPQGARTIEVYDGTKMIGENAFYGCKLGKVTLPESVTTVEDGAFDGSEIQTLCLGKALETFGEQNTSFKIHSIEVPGSAPAAPKLVETYGAIVVTDYKPDDTEDTEKPTEDTEKPTEDTEKPTEDTEKPTEDTEKPTEDTEKPADDNNNNNNDNNNSGNNNNSGDNSNNNNSSSDNSSNNNSSNNSSNTSSGNNSSSTGSGSGSSGKSNGTSSGRGSGSGNGSGRGSGAVKGSAGAAGARSSGTGSAAATTAETQGDVQPTAAEVPATTRFAEQGTAYITGNEELKGWDAIYTQMTVADPGSTIYITMNGTTVVPKDILTLAADKQLTLVLDMGNGISWTIDGSSIDTSVVADTDFGVELGTSNVPANLQSTVTGSGWSTQMHLAHDNLFGLTAQLTVNVGAANANKLGTLFYYNVDNQILEYMGQSDTDADGNVSFSFVHACDYVIVVDERHSDSTAQATSGFVITPAGGSQAESQPAETTEAAETEQPADNAQAADDSQVKDETPKTGQSLNPKYVLCIGVMLLGIYMILTSERQEKQRKRANG